MFKKHSFSLLFTLLLLVQLACNAPSAPSTPDTIATLDALYTVAAQTSTPAASLTPGLPLPTASQILPTASLIAAGPSSTPIILPPNPAPTLVSRCDAASFVKDITIADGATVAGGSKFTKTWQLKNTGTCSWTGSYALVFVSGDAMSGPSVVSLPGNVNPGQTIDLSVNLTAPAKDGHYRGYWKLRNASNVLFGIGASADTAFWVDINVKNSEYTAYDFVNKLCNATWANSTYTLPCPGQEDDPGGYAFVIKDPKLENGNRANGLGLLAVPMNNKDGYISGMYPNFTVQDGDRFRALLSCRYNHDRCDVVFRLDYVSNGKTQTLGSWREVYEGKFYSVDIDLSSLAGKKVQFVLVVAANGSARDDEAIWVTPRIIRSGTPPTPTPTATPSPTPIAPIGTSNPGG